MHELLYVVTAVTTHASKTACTAAATARTAPWFVFNSYRTIFLCHTTYALHRVSLSSSLQSQESPAGCGAFLHTFLHAPVSGFVFDLHC